MVSCFLKSLGRSLGKLRCEGFFVARELLHAVRWGRFLGHFCYFLLCKWDQLSLAQQGDSQHILGMMVGFCIRFEWCELQQFSFHSSRKRNMRHCGLLSVTDLIYINVVRHCVLLRLATLELFGHMCVFMGWILCAWVSLSCCFCACMCLQAYVNVMYLFIYSAETTHVLSGVDRSLLSQLQIYSPQIPQDLQLWVWLSHTPENSRCTVRAPQKKWWHSAHVTVTDSARNLNLGLHRDR